mgnify:CR=1 FL=1
MITKEQALIANRFEHVTKKNADGTPVRARRNGKTKTWKKDPEDFNIPVKYGLKVYFNINPGNASEWNVAP